MQENPDFTGFKLPQIPNSADFSILQKTSHTWHLTFGQSQVPEITGIRFQKMVAPLLATETSRGIEIRLLDSEFFVMSRLQSEKLKFNY